MASFSSDPFKIASDQFHMAVGYCIAKWAQIEDQLFRLCWTALRCPPQQAAIVYFRTPTVDGRLALVSELIRTALPKKAKKDGGHDHADTKTWAQLEKDIRALLATRSRLAHHPVGGHSFQHGIEVGDGDFASIGTSALFQSYVSEYEQWRGRHTDTPPLHYSDLDAHFPALNDVARRLDRFFHLVLRAHVGEPLLQEPPNRGGKTPAHKAARRRPRPRPRSSQA